MKYPLVHVNWYPVQLYIIILLYINIYNYLFIYCLINFEGSRIQSTMTKERKNDTGAIAGAGAIACLCVFIVLGIPMFLASMVLFSFSNGDFDELKYEGYASHCSPLLVYIILKGRKD